MASSTPKLVVSEDSATTAKTSSPNVLPPTTAAPSITANSATHNKQKLTKILSTQASFEKHPNHTITKRFSVDADPSSVILNTPSSPDHHPSPLITAATALANSHKTHRSLDHGDEHHHHKSSDHSSPNGTRSPIRSPSFMKKSDSFLEIPYEKGEIVDLIKLADDPNAMAHVEGQEVLIEHGATNE